ncbi:MAG: glycosyltransferase family 2 protein [Proteobacteria bacterium]|nr:glycosyltransferase family 2 protein [Pseudomonadota bacterium]
MKLSVVTTLYQSAPYIEEFVRRVCAEAGKLTDDYEIILVDDGSPDISLDVTLNIQKTNPHLHIIELSRNFGHHKAMMTGLEHAKGELVFLIDVDLEEPPELLTRFYEEMQKGRYDVVYGVQKEREGSIAKRVGGRLGWWLIKTMLPIHIPPNQSTVRLMKKQYVMELVRHKEHMTAIGGLWVLTGFSQTALLFEKACRSNSSYSFLKRLRMLLDSVTSFSERPLYGVFFLGFGIFIMSSIVALYLLTLKFSGRILDGWISVMVSVWGLGGLILLCIGLVGLYISRIFIETKNRPYTIVKRIHNANNR